MDPRLRTFLVLAGFLSAYGVLVVLLFRWSRNLMARRVQEVADALAAAGAKILTVRQAPGIWSPAVVELTLGGRPASFQMRRYSRDWVLLSLAVPSGPLPHVLIRPERGADRLGKRMGFNREVQIGDAAFDAAAFIDTAESDDVVRRLLERAEVRAAVMAVMASGYRVDMSPEGLKATRVQLSRFGPIDTTSIPAAIAALETLAPLLPAIEPGTLGRPGMIRSPRFLFGTFALAVAGVLGAAVAGLGVRPVADRTDIVHGFAFGVALWLAMVVALFFLLRGGTRALGQFILAAFLLLCGVPVTATMLAFVANSALDGSPALTHRTRVLALPKNPKRSNQVTFESWRPDHETLVIGVPRARMKDMKVGDAAEAVTHAGALGWEWIEEIRALP